MDLWIRSQDREKLVKCNDIAIKTDSEDGENIRGYQIVGYFDKETEYEELGFYVVRKRALEVLDEIQDRLDYVDIVDLGKREAVIGGNMVYEMPEE